MKFGSITRFTNDCLFVHSYIFVFKYFVPISIDPILCSDLFWQNFLCYDLSCLTCCDRDNFAAGSTGIVFYGLV